MSTWLERVTDLMGPKGYDDSMRRSLQTVIFIEAKRGITPLLTEMRASHRKLAFLEQARAVLDSCDFLRPDQKPTVLWRTASSQEIVSDEMAWKRVQTVEKELQRLASLLGPYIQSGRSHQEAVDLLVKKMLVRVFIAL
jgi:hypothetical protein